MKKVVILWILAFLITNATAVHQKVTGSTCPITGSIELPNKYISYKFAISQSGLEDHKIKFESDNSKYSENQFYIKYGTDNIWKEIPLLYKDKYLQSHFQPELPTDKLESNKTKLKIYNNFKY